MESHYIEYESSVGLIRHVLEKFPNAIVTLGSENKKNWEEHLVNLQHGLTLKVNSGSSFIEDKNFVVINQDLTSTWFLSVECRLQTPCVEKERFNSVIKLKTELENSIEVIHSDQETPKDDQIIKNKMAVKKYTLLCLEKCINNINALSNIKEQLEKINLSDSKTFSNHIENIGLLIDQISAYEITVHYDYDMKLTK